MQSSPIHTDRIAVLDQLRGFALLTIFLVNLNQLGAINRSFSFENGSAISVSDQLNDWIHILFGDSSRPLFAFMFGITMVIMYDRAKQRNKNPYWILLRRMIILLLIGVVHDLWIWDGDILFMYALDGLILLLFVSMPAWPLFLFGLLAVFLYQPSPVPILLFTHGQTIELWNYLLLEPSNHILFKPFTWLHPDFSIEFSRATQHFAFFLFGMAAYRSRLFKYKPGFLTLIAGAILCVVGVWSKYRLNTDFKFEWTNLSFFWNFSISLGLTFLFLFFSRKLPFLIEPFTWVGKMTLTNYLLQSVVFVSLFIGTGSTPINRIAFLHAIPFGLLLIAGAVFFAVQMWMSKLWLSRFDYGPVEWLWRIGTNWSLSPMRRRSQANDSR